MTTTNARRPRLRVVLHRRGIVRILNSSWNPSGLSDSLVQVKGPRWFANRAAIWAVRTDPNRELPPVWDSVRVVKAERVSRWRWRVRVEWRRP